MKLVNLTPHELGVSLAPDYDTAAVRLMVCLPTAGSARMKETILATATIGYENEDGYVIDIPIEDWTPGYEVTGLPGPTPDVGLIVSLVTGLALLAGAAGGRTLDDIYLPGPEIRDEGGRVVACRGLRRLCRRWEPVIGDVLNGDSYNRIVRHEDGNPRSNAPDNLRVN